MNKFFVALLAILTVALLSALLISRYLHRRFVRDGNRYATFVAMLTFAGSFFISLIGMLFMLYNYMPEEFKK